MSLPSLESGVATWTGWFVVRPRDAELGGLRYLFLEKNRISDVSALCELKALKQLWLYGNPLQSEDIIMMEQAVPRCEVFF